MAKKILDWSKLKKCKECGSGFDHMLMEKAYESRGVLWVVRCTRCDTFIPCKVMDNYDQAEVVTKLVEAWNQEMGQSEPEPKSNHLNCHQRKNCGGYRPVPVCQKIHQQGCYQELC